MLIEQISQQLLLPPNYLSNLAAGASHHYKAYWIPKRNGERRLIDHPSKPLKAVQRWLAQNIIRLFPVHPAAIAYRRKLNIADNARPHVSSRYLLRVDLHDFFHSLTSTDVGAFLATAVRFLPAADQWARHDTSNFVSFVCKNGRLTIGAPTSPGLCNALCYGLDVQLAALAQANELVYTRYADDLVFSGHTRDKLSGVANSVAEVLSHLGVPAGLRLNSAKHGTHRNAVAGK